MDRLESDVEWASTATGGSAQTYAPELGGVETLLELRVRVWNEVAANGMRRSMAQAASGVLPQLYSVNFSVFRR